MVQIMLLMAEKVQVSRMKKKLLITGRAGFIGLNFLKKSKVLEDFSVTLNLGSEKSTSMYKLYLIILKFFGLERKHFIDVSNIFSLAPIAIHIDCDLSIKYLGKYSSTSLERGLKNTMSW